MKIAFIISPFLFLMSITLFSQFDTGAAALTGPYLGQKPPGMTPEIFAPGIVSKEGIQSNLNVTHDGSEIIFETIVFTPEKDNSPAGRLMYFESITRKTDKWDSPVILPFSRDYVNDEPALSGDGKMLFFVSNRPKDGSGEAQRMPDIWMVKRNGTEWGEPQNIGAPVNTDGVEAQPYYSSDNRLYFGRMDGIYYSQYSDGKFSEPVKLSDSIFQGRVRGICISPDNQTLILHSDKPGGYGGWDLYCSFKDTEGNWMELINMGNAVNTEQPEANATFSSDGKYLFFSRGDDIYWISAKIITELRRE